MKFEKLLAKTWALGQNGFDHARRATHRLAPSVLGLPIKSPLIQFYRADECFETHLSLINYLSHFAPHIPVEQHYSIRVFDRAGRLIDSTNVILRPGEMRQRNLSSLFAKSLDQYGVFSVGVAYFPSFAEELRFLGETSPQFMTLYIPKDGKSSPQKVHSHKAFETWPTPACAVSRPSSCVEDLTQLSQLEVFILNSGPLEIRGRLDLKNIVDGAIVKSLPFFAPGHGVANTKMSSSELAQLRMTVALQIHHSRPIQHRKPILFRTSTVGILSCNHL